MSSSKSLSGKKIALLATDGFEYAELTEPKKMLEEAVSFVRAFGEANKPIAAICHGPWTLINAGQVKGHTMTSWPSLKQDLKNAGARWEDRGVVRDGNLITRRRPDDIPAFGKAFIELLAA